MRATKALLPKNFLDYVVITAFEKMLIITTHTKYTLNMLTLIRIRTVDKSSVHILSASFCKQESPPYNVSFASTVP